MARVQFPFVILHAALFFAPWGAASADAKPSQLTSATAAKTIAPFIDEDTLAVAHVDVSQIDVKKLLAVAAPFFPAGHPLLRMTKSIDQAVESFLKAGGRDVYVIVSVADLPKPGPFVLVPLRKPADEESLRALNGGVPLGERIGDMLFLGNRETRQRLAAATPGPRPELLRALEAVADSPAQAVFIPSATARRVVEELMPMLPAEAGGGPTTTLTRGILWAAMGVGSSPEPMLRLVVQSQSGETARALRHFAAARLREHRPQNDKVGKALSPDVKQDRLLLQLDGEKIAQLSEVLRPLVELSTRASRRRESTDSLKRIGIAIHTYADVYHHLPPPAITDSQGRPLLSWRVAILPYLEQESLYKEFQLDEPWDSERNRKLIERMPAVYRSFASSAPDGRTSFVVAAGTGTVFDGIHGTAIRDITDGSSNTLMAFETDDKQAIVWTKPDDYKFDTEHPSAGFTSPYANGRLTLFCDGSVRFTRKVLDDEAIRRLMLRNDGKPLPALR